MSRYLYEYHRPKGYKAASELLLRRDTKTSPLYIPPYQIPMHDRDVEAFVDLSCLELQYIKVNSDKNFSIGSLTTLQQLTESDVLSSHADGILPQASRFAANHGIRNIADIGGVLSTRQGPPEILLALLVLDAVVVLDDGSSVNITSPDILPPTGNFITEIRIDNKPLTTSLQRIGRTNMDEAIVAVAVALETENGYISGARLALAGVTPRPKRMSISEKLLSQQPYDDVSHRALMAELDPKTDYRGSSEYRLEMAGVLTRRAITLAVKDYKYNARQVRGTTN